MKVIQHLGLCEDDLIPVTMQMHAANNNGIKILGAIILRFTGRFPSGQTLWWVKYSTSARQWHWMRTVMDYSKPFQLLYHLHLKVLSTHRATMSHWASLSQSQWWAGDMVPLHGNMHLGKIANLGGQWISRHSTSTWCEKPTTHWAHFITSMLVSYPKALKDCLWLLEWLPQSSSSLRWPAARHLHYPIGMVQFKTAP